MKPQSYNSQNKNIKYKKILPTVMILIGFSFLVIGLLISPDVDRYRYPREFDLSDNLKQLGLLISGLGIFKLVKDYLSRRLSPSRFRLLKIIAISLVIMALLIGIWWIVEIILVVQGLSGWEF